jgi:hypothetical protein
VLKAGLRQRKRDYLKTQTQTQPKMLESYLSLTDSITLYPEPDGGYTVMMTDLVGVFRKVILWRRIWLIFKGQK